MSENNKLNDKTADNRHFDWGPPANGAADGLKEPLLYLVILVLLGGGVWVMLDINGKKPPMMTRTTAVEAVAVKNSGVDDKIVPDHGLPAVQPPVPAGRFFVQLGAFADEASAREIFSQLTADGFAPTLAEPDQQYEIFRIFVGPFADEKEAEEKAARLNELDFHCFVIESP